MAKPSKPIYAKLIAGIIYNDSAVYGEAIKKLQERFGPLESSTKPIEFTHTKYYSKELGEKLKRTFLTFEGLLERSDLYKVKLWTNALEQELASGEGDNLKRRINIDPGLLCLENMVLASCKGFSHRIYLNEGIYADLTLRYQGETYTTLPWTYADYASRDTIAYLNEVRQNYKNALKEGKINKITV